MGDDRFVSEYMREEFLADLSAEELTFLTRTSVLGRLSAPLCDAVLESDGSGDMLARLARSNVMLAPIDRSDTSYRYHGQFAHVLRSELRRTEPDREAELHLRASDWCEAHADPVGAIDHAIEAHDAQRAGRLLWGSVRHGGSKNDEVVRGRLSRFTDAELSGTPMLALAAAGSRLASGDLYEAERWTSLADDAPDDGDAVRAGVALMRAGLAKQGVTRMRS